MKKLLYNSPQMQEIVLMQVSCFLASGSGNGSGENLGNPYSMTDDDFSSIFG